MKKIIALASLMFTLSIGLFSQSKIAYVDYENILYQMPQMSSVAERMEEQREIAEQIRKEMEQQIYALQTELNNPDLLPIVRAKYTNTYEKAVQDYQYYIQVAQYELDSMREAEIQKVADTLDMAIEEVADEQGFDFVLVKTNGGGYNIVYARNEEDDITDAVLRKLGIEIKEEDEEQKSIKQLKDLLEGNASE